jgi:hypothetical protein
MAHLLVDDGFDMSQQAGRPLMQTQRSSRTKDIFDNVHGIISVDPVNALG